MRKKSIYILSLLFCLLFISCEQEQIDVKTESEQYSTVTKNEVTSLLTTSFKKSSANYVNYNIEDFRHEDIINSSAKMGVLPCKTSNTKEYSRILVLKIQDTIKAVVFNMYPSLQHANDSVFSGDITITNLQGKIQKGYKVEAGLITKLYTPRGSGFIRKTSNTDKEECRKICRHDVDDPHCLCNQQFLDVAVVRASRPIAYISVVDLYGSGIDGSESDSGGWDSTSSTGGGISNAEEDKIDFDPIFDDYPCQKGIVKESYENESDLANSIKQVFDSFNSGNVHLKFGVKNFPLASQVGNTELDVKLVSSPVIVNPNLKQWEIKINFDTDYLNQGTDLAIAATSIHEQMHALLVHANHTGILQVTAALNPSNPSYAELAQAFAKYQEDKDPRPISATQHEYMTTMVNEMTDDLLAFAQQKGINADRDYCKRIMWGKLTETETFKHKFPKFSPNSNIPNPEYLLIVNSSIAEAKNTTQPFTNHPDGNDYTVSPKGKPCN